MRSRPITDLADPRLEGFGALAMARDLRDLRPLRAFLESNRSLGCPEFDEALRAFVLELIKADRINTKRLTAGRPRAEKTATAKSRRQDANLPLYLALDDVRRLKRVWKQRYGRKYRIVDEAIEHAAQRRGVDPEKIRTQRNMRHKDPRKL